MIPELVDIGAKRKVLPLGRYSCSLDDIRERYVPDGDENRSAIWGGLLTVINLVRETVGCIAELWIGGSFITSEENPHDMMLFSSSKKTALNPSIAEAPLFLIFYPGATVPIAESAATLIVI